MKKDRSMLCKVVVFAALIIASCGDGDTNQLTPEERYTVDTLYNNTLSSWRAKLDSTCTKERDTLYKRTVDSLKKEAVSEIELMFNSGSI